MLILKSQNQTFNNFQTFVTSLNFTAFQINLFPFLLKILKTLLN